MRVSAVLLAMALAVAGSWPDSALNPVFSPARAAPPEGSAPTAPQRPSASPREQRLDALFAALEAAPGKPAADAVAGEIWEVWRRSGSAEIDTMMHEAHLLMGAGDAEEALAILDKVVAAAPTFAEGWNRRATLHYMMREPQKSLADIDKVLQLEPRHFGALSGRGLCHLALGQHREALAAFRKALAIHPYLAERFTVIPQLERKLEGDPT